MTNNILQNCFAKTQLFLKSHWLACALTLLVGIFTFIPQILAARSIGNSYQGFPFLYAANEDYYISRARDIVEGYWFVGSPFLFEHKNNLPVVFPTGEYLYALPAIILGVSVMSVALFAKFLLPAALFALVYVLLYQLSDRSNFNKWAAAAGGLLVTLGFDFVDYANTLNLLLWKKEILHVNLWTRPVNPISGALFLFIFLILIVQITRSDKKRYFISAGILLGIMPGYIFSWIVAWTFIGTLGIILLLKKQFTIIKKFLYLAGISVIASAPFIYSWVSSLAAADGQFTALRNGLMLTRTPIVNKVVLLQTVLFLPFFVLEFYKHRKQRKQLDSWWWYATSLVGANWIVFNFQIITGKTVWPPHFVQFTVPFAMLTIVLLINNYLSKKYAKIAWLTVCALISVTIIYGLTSALSYRFVKEKFAALQEGMPLFEWLNKNSQKDCVVLVREKKESLANWIPAFTHCNVYTSNYAFTRVPLDRLEHNYLTTLRLRGIDKKNVEQYLWEHKDQVRELFYTDWVQLFLQPDESWLAEPIQKIKSDYEKFLKKDFVTELKKYKIDYIAGMEELPKALTTQLKSIKYIGKFGSVYIYQL